MRCKIRDLKPVPGVGTVSMTKDEVKKLRVKERMRKADISHGLVFRQVMKNPEICKEFLETVLGVKTLCLSPGTSAVRKKCTDVGQSAKVSDL